MEPTPMSVQHILDAKGSRVVTLPQHSTVDFAARRMRLAGIGSIVVSDDDRSIAGIISERDILHGFCEHGAAVGGLPISQIMTRSVPTCKPDDSIASVMRLMTLHRVRHMPVVKDGTLAGIVSIGDVVKNRLEDMELEANVLRDVAIARG
jgi:CBS domain-containing protein